MKTGAGNVFQWTMSKGIPGTTIRLSSETLILEAADDISVYVPDSNSPVDIGKQYVLSGFRMQVKKMTYLFSLPEEAKVNIGRDTITLQNVSQLSFVVLPDDADENVWREHMPDITGTQVMWAMHQSKLTTQFNILHNGPSPVIALLPHQQDSLANPLSVVGSYQTIRGRMKAYIASRFTMQQQVPVTQKGFPALKSETSHITQALKEDVHAYLTQAPPESRNYFYGTWLGKGTTLILLCESLGLTAEKEQLTAYLKLRLREGLEHLRYDEDQTSMVSTKPEFGNEKLNDHHFHYGYFIRAAAILSMNDTNFRDEIRTVVDSLVGDLATTDRNSTRFPFLRVFDVYESHSWADGYANFFDGNNQESTSEAIHAWWAVWLWADVTRNTELKNTAMYLYTSEITGARYYWFGDNGMYVSPYGHAIVSILWGGKVEFATWFSNAVEMKYGIQFLPYTPASGYLSSLASASAMRTDFERSGGSFINPWGDLFLIFTSFYDPEIAQQQEEKVIRPEDNTPESLRLYMVALSAQRK
jgi:endoglucanase Acf2